MRSLGPKHAATWSVALGALLVIAPPRAARAEDTSRVAAATVLFDEGIAAMNAGRLGEACPKLAKSQQLAPSGGTLLALGDCHERAGRIASAWVAFREAASRAAAAGKSDAEARALDRAAQLEPRLPRLTVTAARTEGLEIRRDGVLITPAELGLPIPIDPGRHELRASSPGARAWSKSIDLKEGAPATVEVPLLQPETTPPPPPPGPGPAPPGTSDGSTQRTLGVVAGSVGLAAIGVGSAFGVLAMNANDEAKTYCRGSLCRPEGLALTDDANAHALVSTILFIAGGAAIVGGAVLYFTAPSGTSTARPSLRLAPTWTASSAGGSAVLRW